MLYKTQNKYGQKSHPARAYLQKLDQIKRSGRPWTPLNILQQSDVQLLAQQEQPIKSSIVHRIQCLNRETDYPYRQCREEEDFSGNLYSERRSKPNPTFKTEFMEAKESNQLLKLKIVEMQKVIYKMMNQKSPSNEYKKKYRQQREKISILQKQKHGLEVLLKLEKEQYEQYRLTAEKMLADRHEVQQQLYEVQSQIKTLSQMLLNKGDELEFYKQENYKFQRQVQKLKKQLFEKSQIQRGNQREIENQKSSRFQNVQLLRQIGNQEKEQIRLELRNKQLQLSHLTNLNQQIMQKLQSYQRLNFDLKAKVDEYQFNLQGKPLSQIMKLNSQLQNRIRQLEANIHENHNSGRQSLKLYQTQIEQIKQSHKTQLQNFDSDLRRSKQEVSSLTKLLQLLKNQNQDLNRKLSSFEKIIQNNLDREQLMNDLQRKLIEAGESNLHKSKQIQALENTIQKYLSDIQDLTHHHSQLESSLQLHRKIHQQYKIKYEQLELTLSKRAQANSKFQESNNKIQEDNKQIKQLNQIKKIANSNGYDQSCSLCDWIQDQIKDLNQLLQTNMSLKKTLSNLNREIQDKWVRQKILDMQEIQRLRDIISKYQQNEERQSKANLEIIREESKQQLMSFQSFRQKLVNIKNTLNQIVQKNNLTESFLFDGGMQEDLQEEIEKILLNISRFMSEQNYQIAFLTNQNECSKRSHQQTQMLVQGLKQQVRIANELLVQKQQLNEQLLKQKQKLWVRYSSFGQVPIDYSEDESKKSISFKLQSHVFTNIQSKHQIRATIREKMRLLISEYLAVDNDVLSASIQQLFVDVYELCQWPQLFKFFEKFLEEVKLYHSLQQRKKNQIKGVVDQLIQQSHSLIQSDNEMDDQFN